MLAGLIYDMDGVLVDSMPHVNEVFTAMCTERGIPLTIEHRARLMGRTLPEVLRELEQEHSVSFDCEQFGQELWARQKEGIREHHRDDPALVSLLAEAAKGGIPQGVATGSPRWRADELLGMTAFAHYFACIVAQEDVTHSKPHPDPFLKAAEVLGVPPEHCVVFEDAISGIQGAKAAGMKAVAIVNNGIPREQYNMADLIVMGFEEINLDKVKRLYLP